MRRKILVLALGLFWVACGGGVSKNDVLQTDAGMDFAFDKGLKDLAGETVDAKEEAVFPDADGLENQKQEDTQEERVWEDEGEASSPDFQSDVEDVGDVEVGLDSKDAFVCQEDDLPCTRVYVSDNGECVTEIVSGFCLIDSQCYFALQPSPFDQCLFCVPEVSQTEFVPYQGLVCDDGDPCTAPDRCGSDGVCYSFGQTDCNDLNPCTIDYCKQGEGCQHVPYESECDDNDACTYNDHCVQGRCTGLKVPCASNNPCITAYCDHALGCVFAYNQEPCDDGDECTVNDTCSMGTCKGVPRDCDDHDPCTDDSCLPDHGCYHTYHYRACDDGNACTVNDYCNASHVCTGYPVRCDDHNPCTQDMCDPNVGCVFAPRDGIACDDQDPCTVNDRCVQGTCKGTPIDCEDGNLCTRDYCDVFGCHHEPITGACDDKNACTTGETCVTGQCIGTQVSCDDNNPCTNDSCDPMVGCIHEPIFGFCDDHDPCTDGDHCENGKCVGYLRSCDDGDPCTADFCDQSGVCRHQVYTGPCDDGNACTVGERCIDGVCKGGSQVNCDDNNPCTVDTCNEQWGCIHTPTPPKPCDDHSVCTVQDTCKDGICQGTPIACDDHNPCTYNLCDAVTGCYYEPFSGPCDDMNVCTINDQCAQGVCSGTSKFFDPVGKTTSLSFGVSGNVGQGLDVDGNQATCAPKGSCVKGIDNAFSILSWLFNPEVVKAVGNGSFAMFLEFRSNSYQGGPYPIAIYYGRLHIGASCDPNVSGCYFDVYSQTVSGQCDPLFMMDNAVIEGNTLRAGGQGYFAPIFLVFGDLRLKVVMAWARLEAQLSLSQGFGYGQGVLAGAIRQQDLITVLQSAPASGFPPPYTKDIVIQYVQAYLQPDLDVDGDGQKESISIGLPFVLVPAHLITKVD